MNCLITTFDGFGDGVIYYPIFKFITENNKEASFYITDNLFFSDKDILNDLKLPKNFNLVDSYFRKFQKEHWGDILGFILINKITKIINLRFMGKDFEKDYFKFKNWINSKKLNILFFDSENVVNIDRGDLNLREVAVSIIENALQNNIYPNSDLLKSVFKPEVRRSNIFINMHSRGDFKLWNIKKWSEVISHMVFFGKKVMVYEGFSSEEKEYTKIVLSKLPEYIREKIEVICVDTLFDLASFLKESYLLISTDSGLIHLADSLGINSIGIYLTTYPMMWGGISKNFYFVKSKHLNNCKNYYQQFGMCINNKNKCKEISEDKDDISVNDILGIVSKIYE